MGILDDLLGGFFDLDGDGHTDLGEEFMAFQFFVEMKKEERRRQGLPVDDLDDDIFYP